MGFLVLSFGILQKRAPLFLRHSQIALHLRKNLLSILVALHETIPKSTWHTFRTKNRTQNGSRGWNPFPAALPRLLKGSGCPPARSCSSGPPAPPSNSSPREQPRWSHPPPCAQAIHFGESAGASHRVCRWETGHSGNMPS